MLIHPLLLYIGMVGFVVPFAFGLAAMLSGQLGTVWMRTTRRWTLFAWFFLSVGILMGGRWAYEVLGWGGYWAWDPVENASLMPWLAGTAFLHSVMVQEKRDMLKIWNLILIGLTYSLCLFGTMLTRSGLVQSVHAFAQTKVFGLLFLGYVLLTVAVFFGVLISRRKALRSSNRLESILSRESGFLLNNWIFMVILAVVLWGTMFPKISEWLTGTERMIGPLWFNKLNAPLALLLLLLTGAGPLIAWRRASRANLRKQFLWPGVAAVLTAGALLAWFRSEIGFFPLATWSLSSFVVGTIFQEYFRAIRARMRGGDENLLQAFGTLMRKNQRRYGGYVVHLGVVFILIGIAGAAFNEERLENVHPGDSIEIDGYRLEYRTASAHPEAALRRGRGADRPLPGRPSVGDDDAGETHVLAAGAAGLDSVGVFDAARRPLRGSHCGRVQRLGHTQDPPQSAGELDLDRWLHLRGGNPVLHVALPGEALGMRRAAALCLLALLVTAQATQAQETRPAPPNVPAGPGTIRGRVVHQEDPERSLGGVSLILYALTHTGLAGVRHGASDAEGRFRFEGVANDPTTPYLIGAEYQGVTYPGARVVFESGEVEREVEIRVAEVTGETQSVSIPLVRLRIDWLGTRLRVAESLTIRNGSSRTVYVPSEARGTGSPALRAHLPAGAEEFAMPHGLQPEGVEHRDGKVTFWGPLYPGEQDLSFSYAIPVSGERVDIDTAFPSGTERDRGAGPGWGTGTLWRAAGREGAQDAGGAQLPQLRGTRSRSGRTPRLLAGSPRGPGRPGFLRSGGSPTASQPR